MAKKLSEEIKLRLCEKFAQPDAKFCNVQEAPFGIHGLLHADGKYRRMPEDLAKSVSEGVYKRHDFTTGGRVRFRTDSPFVAIYAEMTNVSKMQHMPFTGSVGFDMYVDDKFSNIFLVPFDVLESYEGIFRFPKGEMRDITINFPISSGVKELYVGLSANAQLCPPKPYAIEKPIVYYGSSITQGGCASRPGMTYQSILSRRFNADYINLGFSSSALGEDEMAEYINKLEMSCLVYDYDCNAPSPEYLKNTHERMFKAIRKANPRLPVIMLPRPMYVLDEEYRLRRQIVKESYDKAVASGDRHVYYVDGSELMSLAREEGTVDGIHPTDFGFVSMAKAVGEVLEEIFK